MNWLVSYSCIILHSTAKFIGLVGGVSSACQQSGEILKNVTINDRLEERRIVFVSPASSMQDCVTICCQSSNFSAAYLAKGKCYGVICQEEGKECNLINIGKPSSTLFVKLLRQNPQPKKKQSGTSWIRNVFVKINAKTQSFTDTLCTNFTNIL